MQSQRVHLHVKLTRHKLQSSLSQSQVCLGTASTHTSRTTAIWSSPGLQGATGVSPGLQVVTVGSVGASRSQGSSLQLAKQMGCSLCLAVTIYMCI